MARPEYAEVALWREHARSITRVNDTNGKAYHPVAYNVFTMLTTKYLQIHPDAMAAVPDPPREPDAKGRRAKAGAALGQISATRVYEDLTTVARRHSLHLPSDLMLLARVAAMGEGLGANLDPNFRLMEFATPYFKRFWQKSHSLAVMTERLKDNAVDLADFMSDFPERAIRLTGMLERGELTVRSRVEVPDATLQALVRIANRTAMSILMAGLIVGLSVLAYSPAGSQGVGFLAFRILLAIAIGCGVWLFVSFWKSTRPHP